MNFRIGPLPGRGSSRKALLAAFWLLVVTLLPAAPLSAHGGGKQQIAGETAGPYRIYVWSSPDPWRAGEAHTTVAVTRLLESGEETPATGLQVSVSYQQEGERQAVAAVEQTGAQAGYYEADNTAAAAGEWVMTVDVTGPEGAGSVRFRESVLPAAQFNWLLVGGGALLLLLLIGYFGTRVTGKTPVQRGASL